MAAWKLPPCTRVVSPPPPPSSIQWALPGDVLLEIVARSDTLTLFRCAAACKPLRRDILNQSFIDRVTQQGGVILPCILIHLNIHDDDNADGPPPPALSLAHPATPAVVSFFDHHLSPYMSRFADDFLGKHYKVARSRGGLVLLRRRNFSSSRQPNVCVYDLVTGHRTFLSYPPGINPINDECFDSCTLLTDADGIGSSFLLFCPRLVTRRNRSSTRTIKVHVFTSTSGDWKPAAMSDDDNYFRSQDWFAMHRDAVVLHGGVIHWLVRSRGVIVTYNVRTMEHATINLPEHNTNSKEQLHLGTSSHMHDGRKLLCLLRVKGFNISMWPQLPSGDWPSKPVMIDTEEKLRALDPDICPGRPFQFANTGSNAVLLRISSYGPSKSYRGLLFILDLETMEIRVLPDSTAYSRIMEIDLPSRLRAMKNFS